MLGEWKGLRDGMDGLQTFFQRGPGEKVFRKLRELIDRLPEERRQIILMSMEGMSGEEIAERSGVTIHTVKQQKYRAYNFIRELLGKQWVVFALFFM